MVLVASHACSKLRFPHIWKLHETKFERKQFGGNSIANRSPVKIGKQSDPIPRRQEVETGRASDEKRISWNNLDLSKGRKTVSPNVGFQGFSSYVELELQPSVPGKFLNKDRFVDGFAVEPLCFFVARYVGVVWCLYGLKGLIVTTGLFSCWRTTARFLKRSGKWKSLEHGTLQQETKQFQIWIQAIVRTRSVL